MRNTETAQQFQIVQDCTNNVIEVLEQVEEQAHEQQMPAAIIKFAGEAIAYQNAAYLQAQKALQRLEQWQLKQSKQSPTFESGTGGNASVRYRGTSKSKGRSLATS